MSPRWSDHFTRRARAEGWGARSVFKLEEIQRRTRIVRPGDVVLDLGCFPGSWSRFLIQAGVRRLVGVDLQVPQGIQGIFLAADALTVEPSVIRDALDGPADLVLSDMAPSTTGHRLGDHVRQVALARRALTLAAALLRPSGRFVVKVFEGEEAPGFVRDVRERFEEVRRLRPEATRRHSIEFFVVARGYRARVPDP
ncbi:MAG: RlmE family RNA methyltransferase [Deltaproteobacteria bacterium]|nr:RlmE family RNA methyltransferase [Deltaproteobacteria bacterium]